MHNALRHRIGGLCATPCVIEGGHNSLCRATPCVAEGGARAQRLVLPGCLCTKPCVGACACGLVVRGQCLTACKKIKHGSSENNPHEL